jgi:hypothetical protein
MKANRIVLIMVIAALFATMVLAQGRGGGRKYNPATETTVKGTVEDVQQLSGKGGGGTGTHLTLKTDAGTLDVHVGPTSFLTAQQVSFAKGDQIEVTGSKVNTDTLIAREIKRGDKVLTLRDKQGIPAWSQGRASTKQ